MELTYLGHACFKITSFLGTTLLMDPYTPGGPIRHRPIPDIVDGVVVSHGHPGHYGIRYLQGQPEVFHQSNYLRTMELIAIPTFHDARKGKKFGPNTVGTTAV